MKKTFVISNAAEQWKNETSEPSIPTFSQSLDHVLGDGIQLGSLTEVLSLPGSGKTQLCMQLCASIQIPKSLGGLNAEALFVDTNTNFTPHRFRDILMATLRDCHKLDPSVDTDEQKALSKLHYVNAFGLEKFCSVIQLLPKFIQEHSKIKIIVIDSIVFPFKEGMNATQRTGLLYRQMAVIQKVAVENKIAVVMTNEMTTRPGLSSGSIVGALGDGWSHRCNHRLVLSTPDISKQERIALMMKSNNAPNLTGRFQITCEGIRDV